jgi:hypothetical protein
MTETVLKIVRLAVDNALLYFRQQKGLDRLVVFV